MKLFHVQPMTAVRRIFTGSEHRDDRGGRLYIETIVDGRRDGSFFFFNVSDLGVLEGAIRASRTASHLECTRVPIPRLGKQLEIIVERDNLILRIIPCDGRHGAHVPTVRLLKAEIDALHSAICSLRETKSEVTQ